MKFKIIGAAITVTLSASCVSSMPEREGPEREGPERDGQARIDLDDAGPLQEIGSGDSFLTQAEGVWGSRGYGYVLTVSDQGIVRYHDNGELCFTTPTAAAGATDTLSLEYKYVRMSPDQRWAVFQLLPDDTQVVFDRIDALPERCRAGAPDTPEAVFDVFVDLFQDHYAFFEARNIDWPMRVAAARQRLSPQMTPDELFDLLASMIDGFSDSHTKLIATIDGETRRQQDGLGQTLPMVRNTIGETPWLISIIESLLSETLSPGYHVANDRIIWGLIDNRIGYIQVFIMGGFSGVDIGDPDFRDTELSALDDILDEALSAYSEADAVIIDLSNNRGGYDAIARRLASRFTDKPFVAYKTQQGAQACRPSLELSNRQRGSGLRDPSIF